MLDQHTLDRLFRTARSHNGWHDRPVAPTLLRQLYDLVKWGPTSANCQPMRLVFVTSAEGRALLAPLLNPGNLQKTMTAPVTAIVGYDLDFPRHLPRLFPHNPDAAAWFAGPEKQAFAAETAFRNGTLQGGYLILAARALGLDCGPMSGFDAAGVAAAFFPGQAVRVNFLCNLGYGDDAHLFGRLPRLDFEDSCRFA